MQDSKIKIPVVANMCIINGEAVMVDAEYAEMEADNFARLLLEAFDIPTDKNQIQGEVEQ